ncbi:hypothetical protein JCM16418_4312 [Paenibacillus pini JCM 16418]|uniref:Uncharacterized protein n=1 Tax=Paenibacillus pini JCM 16418 TaxID=1236976 RepID=W7YGU7_9BACL|nr:hypothetical protein JCM16418_4312 [Paenibacillus pini JCM 16418]
MVKVEHAAAKRVLAVAAYEAKADSAGATVVAHAAATAVVHAVATARVVDLLAVAAAEAIQGANKR